MRALLVTLVLAGCVAPEQQRDCRLNSDCLAPLLCQDGRCVPECREDRDCAAAEICVAGVCEPEDPPARLCTRTRDCEQGETCRGGLCEVVGLVREDGGAPNPPPADAGFPASDTGVLPGRDAGPAGPDGGARDTGVSPRDSGVPAAPDAGGANLPYGAVCTTGAQCSSNLCLGGQGALSGRCTKVCGSAMDCYYPDTCIDVPGAGHLCATPNPGKPTGAPCPSGANECASGLCLTPPGSAAICTQQCSPLPGCPSGLVCTPVPDGRGGAVAVCASGGPGLGFGETCTGGSQCATQLCLGVGGAASGACTSMCDQVPCPPGYDCSVVSDGAGGSFRICAPTGAAGGAFGSSCAGASECTSGLCLASPGGAFCTRGCGSDTDCQAIAGLSCLVLAGGTQVCGPP